MFAECIQFVLLFVHRLDRLFSFARNGRWLDMERKLFEYFNKVFAARVIEIIRAHNNQTNETNSKGEWKRTVFVEKSIANYSGYTFESSDIFKFPFSFVRWKDAVVFACIYFDLLICIRSGVFLFALLLHRCSRLAVTVGTYFMLLQELLLLELFGTHASRMVFVCMRIAIADPHRSRCTTHNNIKVNSNHCASNITFAATQECDERKKKNICVNRTLIWIRISSFYLNHFRILLQVRFQRHQQIDIESFELDARTANAQRGNINIQNGMEYDYYLKIHFRRARARANRFRREISFKVHLH